MEPPPIHEYRGKWSRSHCDVIIIWHQRGKPFVSQSFRQSGTSHPFITGCAPRAPSEYAEALFTSSMWDVSTYPCRTYVQHAYAITSAQHLGDVTAHNIYACRRKYATSSMSFWPSDSRLLMKVFLCDSLLFEYGTIKYCIFVLKLKCLSFPRALCLGMHG